MRSPHPVGTRIAKLDNRLKRLALQSYEWGGAISFVAPPSGAPASDPRATHLTLTPPHAGARPWPPAQLRARRLSSGAVTISWVRHARRGGDYWGKGDPALDVPAEGYQLDILSGSTIVRSVSVTAASYSYSVVDQTADFGGLPSSLRLRVAQLDAGAATGLNRELTLLL